MAAATALQTFRPEDEDFYLGDPDAAFRRLRAERSAALVRAEPVLGGHQVRRRPDGVAAAAPVLLGARHAALRAGAACARRVAARRMAAFETPTIIRMDPPAHNRHRKLVIGAFTKQRVAALEPMVRDIAKRSLDAIDPTSRRVRRAAGDPAADVRDRGDARRAVERLRELPALVGRDDRGGRRRAVAEHRRGGRRAAALRARRRERAPAPPQDDLVSVLVEAEIDGERLTDVEIGMFCLTLLVAGNETTRNLVSGGALALMRNPDAAREAARRPGPLAERGRGDAALRLAGAELRAHRHRGLRAARQEVARGRRARALLQLREPRRGDLRPRRRRASTSRGRARGATWRSASASTCAWAPRWRASRRRCCSRSSSRAGRTSRWPASREPLRSSLMNGLVELPVALEP